MLGDGGTPLSKLKAAIGEYRAREVDPSEDDLNLLRSIIDALKAELVALEAARPVPERGGEGK
ncbi:MAG: hypothetical protein PVS3B2_09250 [Candidatus Dormibacteraceae bacterium]